MAEYPSTACKYVHPACCQKNALRRRVLESPHRALVFFLERAPWHADDRAEAWQERSRRSGEAPSDRVQKWRRCSIAAYPHSDWGGYSGSAWARSRPLSRGDTREGSGCNTMTGSWPGQCISSVITRPGARRADTTQHAETEVRRLCAGLRPDRETIFDAYSQDGSPSQPQERERAHDLRAGGAPCRVSPGNSPATAHDGDGPATSTHAWYTSRPSGPTSASPSLSDARSITSAHHRRRRRARVRATGPASWRPSVQSHMQLKTTAVCGAGRRDQLAAWLAGAVPRQDEEPPRLPGGHVATTSNTRAGGSHIGPPAKRGGIKHE